MVVGDNCSDGGKDVKYQKRIFINYFNVIFCLEFKFMNWGIW